jgi:hypothetical protein
MAAATGQTGAPFDRNGRTWHEGGYTCGRMNLKRSLMCMAGSAGSQDGEQRTTAIL